MADAVDDFDVTLLPETGEDFFFDQHVLEEFEIFFDDPVCFGEDDEHERCFANERLALDLADVGDDGLPPLLAVAGMSLARRSVLPCGLDLEPERLARPDLINRVEKSGGFVIESKRLPEWREHEIAPHAAR